MFNQHDWKQSRYVRPLGEAQNEFLQVLLTEFQVRPRRGVFRMGVQFDFNTPAVWLHPNLQTFADNYAGLLQKMG